MSFASPETVASCAVDLLTLGRPEPEAARLLRAMLAVAAGLLAHLTGPAAARQALDRISTQLPAGPRLHR